MNPKLLLTVTEFVAAHSHITERDVRMCIKGTHPTLPPLRARVKSLDAAVNAPFLITAEDAAAWREALPVA